MSAAVALKQRWLQQEGLADEDRRRIARRARAEQCKRSLYQFVLQSFHVLEPGEKLEHNWHLEAFCFHVQNMLEGWLVANGHAPAAMVQRVIAYWESHGLTYIQGYLLVQNLILNLPPITLKSRILMVCAPAWMWLHCPSWSLCAISSVDDNVERDSNHHRELVQSEWYKETFEIKWKIKDGSKERRRPGQPANENASKLVKSDSVKKWGTTAGGERKSRTMLGGFTGVHVDAIFLDDPDDAHKVFSEPKRREVQDKWRRAIKNRVKHPNRSIRIAIQQRVHSDDWTAAQIANGLWSPEDRMAWAWVVIPLQYGKAPEEAPEMSPWFWTDPRRVANENLQPTRFSDEFIADEIRDKGPEGFEGQYNQNPASFEDGMIKRSYVRFFRLADVPQTTRSRPPGCGVDEHGNETPTHVVRYREDGSLDLDWLTITVDCSNGSEAVTASQVGILVVGGKDLYRFVFDDRTAIMGIEAMYDAIAACVQAYPVGRVLIELKAAGPSVINDLTKRLRAGEITNADGSPKLVTIEAIKVDSGDSKESRAAAMVSAWALGLVHVLEGATWLYPKMTAGGKLIDEGFVNEICTFPRSRKNDRVDAMSQLMAFYSMKGDASSKARAYKAMAGLMRRS